MNTPIAFVSAGSVVVSTPAGGVPMTFNMPAPDSGNVDLQVQADAGSTACIAFGPGLQVGLEAPGALIVKPGQAALLTAQSALLARPGNPLAAINCPLGRNTIVPITTAIAGTAATATQCTVVTSPPGGSVTITRGTATATTIF